MIAAMGRGTSSSSAAGSSGVRSRASCRARGAQVRIFEGRTIAAGATQASAGMLAPYIEAPRARPALRSDAPQPRPLRRLRRTRRRRLRLADRIPALRLARDRHRRSRGGRASRTRRCGGRRRAAMARRRSRHGASSPRFRDTIAGALLAPSHGYVAVSSLTDALVWAALRHGAETRNRARTFRNDRAARRSPRRHGRRRRDVDGATVVDRDGQLGGPDPGSSIRRARTVRPIRGQLLRLAWQAHAAVTRALGEGLLRRSVAGRHACWSARRSKTWASTSGRPPPACATCWTRCASCCPRRWGATFIDARAGLRPATPDGLPIIGRSPTVEGLVYATGHYRNGVLLAPLTAAIVADLILDGRRRSGADVHDAGRIAIVELRRHAATVAAAAPPTSAATSRTR